MSRVIDPRARLVCSLGLVDSGGTSRDKAIDTWLLRYSGNLEIVGSIAPARGTRVELAYLWRGGLTRFPVRHYVLSASTTAYGRMTTVKIGCRLALLEQRKPLEPFRASAYPPAWYEALPESSRLEATPPITAQGLLQWAAAGLGMTIAPGSANLIGNMLREEVSASDGYCDLLAKLLQSHGCVACVNANEQLHVRRVSMSPAPGPIFDRWNLIEVSPIGGSNGSAQSVGVQYTATVLPETIGSIPPVGVVPSGQVLAVSAGAPRLLPPDSPI